MTRLKLSFTAIVYCLALGLPVGAGPAVAAEAERRAGEDPLRIELQRLQRERQKALDKARDKTRDARSKRTRRSRPDEETPERVALSLPPGWDARETEKTAGGFALGDAPPWSENRIGMKVYRPDGEVSGGGGEWILVERFRKSRSITLSHAYRRWRGKVIAGCEGASVPAAPVQALGKQDGFDIIESFYVCPKRKADHYASISLLKAITGRRGLAVINRFWHGPPFEPGQAKDPETVVADWHAWAEGVTLAGADSAGAPPEGKKDGEMGKDGTAKLSKGYGFIVSRRGHVVTSHHLVTGCRRLRFSSQAAALLANDPVKGLALFKLRREAAAVAVFRKGSEAGTGDPVVLTSYPPEGGLATDRSVSTGVLSARVGPGGDPRQISVSAPIPPGASGIPLVDLFGTVAGMALDTAEALKMAGVKPDGAGAVKAGGGGNFALGAGTLRRFLDGQGVVYETSEAGEILSPGDAAEKARAATVFVECWK